MRRALTILIAALFGCGLVWVVLGPRIPGAVLAVVGGIAMAVDFTVDSYRFRRWRLERRRARCDHDWRPGVRDRVAYYPGHREQRLGSQAIKVCTKCGVWS